MEDVVAYYSLFEEKGQTSFMGGLLCLDVVGKPLEFYCSTPVKPNEVQRILYGKSLERHVGVELCGRQLAKKLTGSPNIMFVDSEHLLEMRLNTTYPVCFIRKVQSDRFNVAEDSGLSQVPLTSDKGDTASLIQLITLESHTEERKKAEELVKMLIERGQDPSEPFERLKRAMDKLRAEDSRFK